MKTKALFLGCLFLLVIAFPGYGRFAKNEHNNTVVQHHQSDATLFLILERCLQTGINMVEEERGQEEGDDTSSSLCFVMSSTVLGNSQAQPLMQFGRRVTPHLQPVSICGTYPPPDSK